ncbi:MAG TPA: tetratricopeptide repeat protein [Chloroflexota bacterium]|nr:tetratricopeptide repeat protein [Chloroflexota bacterium]
MTSAIAERVIPVKIKPIDPANHSIVERYQQVWTPTIMLLAPDGQMYYEWNGYLPPDLYVAQFIFGLGKAALKRDRLDDAARCFDEVVAKYPTSDVAPDACYWAAVARYKGSHEADDLLGGWRKLQSRYPNSIARVKQSFTEG